MEVGAHIEAQVLVEEVGHRKVQVEEVGYTEVQVVEEVYTKEEEGDHRVVQEVVEEVVHNEVCGDGPQGC